VKPDGIEALQTIPSFSGFTESLALGADTPSSPPPPLRGRKKGGG